MILTRNYRKGGGYEKKSEYLHDRVQSQIKKLQYIQRDESDREQCETIRLNVVLHHYGVDVVATFTVTVTSQSQRINHHGTT